MPKDSRHGNARPEESPGGSGERGAPELSAEVSVEDKALMERPSLTIRTRIILSFTLFFLLCASITVWSIWALSELEAKIQFLEIADSYLVDIQQARRFEKNYLLYGTNLDDALEHLASAEKTFKNNYSTIARILDPRDYDQIAQYLGRYHKLMVRLGETQTDEARASIEPQLREYGGQMVSFAEEFVRKEKMAVDRMLVLAKRVPFYCLAALLVCMAFVANFLTRQLLANLNRFMAYTRRVGEGDFSLISPARKYKDEFSHLAAAFNHMIRELDRRQLILVESHKLRAVGTLVAGVAHELNNPLNNTMLTACTLLDDATRLNEEEKLDMVQDIISETERSQRIVRNLLDFARESETHVKPLSIAKIVEDSIRLVANQLKLAKVRLETSFAADLPSVHGDEQMLKQVFVNLILNALDALPPKGTIWISTRKDTTDGYVAVEVKDNGRGIPEHVLTRVFDPFFTTKTRGKGTGLGLSVSQGIIRRMAGYIRVKSVEGTGSTFTVLLPVTDIPSLVTSGK